MLVSLLSSPLKVILRFSAQLTTFLSCTTLTASVSSIPAPTWMILRFCPEVPMESGPHALALCMSINCSSGGI